VCEIPHSHRLPSPAASVPGFTGSSHTHTYTDSPTLPRQASTPRHATKNWFTTSCLALTLPPSLPPSPSPGIRWHKCNRKWEVQIKYRGKKLSLGYYDDELQAAQCYDRRAKELYDTPLLNFLPGGKLNPDRKRRVDPRSLRYASFPPFPTPSLPPSLVR